LALVIWLNKNFPFLPFVSEFFRYKYEVACNDVGAKSQKNACPEIHPGRHCHPSNA